LPPHQIVSKWRRHSSIGQEEGVHEEHFAWIPRQWVGRHIRKPMISLKN
jgi:hypothetical protein